MELHVVNIAKIIRALKKRTLNKSIKNRTACVSPTIAAVQHIKQLKGQIMTSVKTLMNPIECLIRIVIKEEKKNERQPEQQIGGMEKKKCGES